MSLPRIATREEWLAARRELLTREKELTRQRDALSAERRSLPMVEVHKDYAFDGPNGTVALIDMFDGRRQLVVYHFMFDPAWEQGCPSCSAGTDELSAGFFEHLRIRDTSYAMVSRAPLAKLERWKATKGWDLSWYSSYGPTSTTTSGSPSTSQWRPLSTTFAARSTSRRGGQTSLSRASPSSCRAEAASLKSRGGCFTPTPSTPVG